MDKKKRDTRKRTEVETIGNMDASTDWEAAIRGRPTVEELESEMFRPPQAPPGAWKRVVYPSDTGSHP